MIEKKTIYYCKMRCGPLNRKTDYWLSAEKMISSFYETAIYMCVQGCKDILLNIEREKRNSRVYELIVFLHIFVNNVSYQTYLIKRINIKNEFK